MTPRRNQYGEDYPPGPSNRRRDAKRKRAHGWSRSGDRDGTAGSGPRAARTLRVAPPGMPLLVLVVVAILASVGIARVHMRTRVLEMGAEISELTGEHSRLLDRRRRLEAERAYLRHPDQIGEIARRQLQMVPVEAQRVQRIKLLPENPR